MPECLTRVLKGWILGLAFAIPIGLCVGYLIYTSRLYYRTDWIFTGIVTLGLIGLLADRLLRFIGKKLLYRFGVR